ncbi:hypothetical protein BP5796_00732 [Coleophoma crateriformis]|uniref:Uncharacterized protein n=1 Tax=Coleophoma crateriformis TaxID=565419 RepID=A0A3D8T8S3_9HELO|nr:hypothetical protein BP5796_00732 [Coleophoma crateriformis]
MATTTIQAPPVTLKQAHKPLAVAIKERIGQLMQPSPDDEYEEGLALIKSKLSKMTVVNALFSVNLGSNHPNMIIDARSEIPTVLESTTEELAGKIKIRPNTIKSFVDGLMEPRFAIHWGYFMVEGKQSVGMKFIDALGPYNPSPLLFNAEDKLPQPTEDITRAKRDLEEFGYGLVKNAITPDEVKVLYARLKEQAAAEANTGVAQFDGGVPGTNSGPNQRVWSLANKGQEFLDLLESKVIDQFLPDILGDDAILFSYNANIFQPPVRDMALGFNMFFFLGDVTKETGGTLIMPKSHKGQIAPDDLTDTSNFISIEGPAGTCLVLDSRTWHSTGRNVKAGSERPVIIAFFARPEILQNETFSLSLRPNVFFSLDPETEAALTDKVKKWSAWKEMIVDRQQDPIGKLFTKGETAV